MFWKFKKHTWFKSRSVGNGDESGETAKKLKSVPGPSGGNDCNNACLSSTISGFMILFMSSVCKWAIIFANDKLTGKFSTVLPFNDVICLHNGHSISLFSYSDLSALIIERIRSVIWIV